MPSANHRSPSFSYPKNLSIFSRNLLLLLVISLGCLLLKEAAYAQDQEVATASEEGETEKTTSDKATPTPVPLDPRTSYSGGYYFGHIISVDPQKRFFFVKPSDEHYPRRVFYLDSKTSYTEIVDKKRKKRKIGDFIEGRKIAIRYFSLGLLAVVEEAFLVKGEFDPKAYQKQRAVKKVAPKEGGAGAHGGGHGGGEGKKPEKKIEEEEEE